MFSRRRSGGFTLIEMIVSLAIFSVVAVIALGAMMKIINANKKAQSLLSAMTNINYALESMSREMRVGSNFSCGDIPYNIDSSSYSTNVADCNTGYLKNNGPGNNQNDGIIIAFKSSHTASSGPNSSCNLIYAYSFGYRDANSWDIKKAAQTTCGDNLSSSNNGNSSYTSIIDPNVIITGYYVKVTGDIHPLATIRISGYVGAREQERTYFDVQTAVSARIASN